MSYTEKECAISTKEMPTKAEQVLNNFLRTNDIPEVKNSLTDLLLDWVASDTEADQFQRSLIVVHYRNIMELLNSIETFKNELS